jgi:serine/threonine protein kinase
MNVNAVTQLPETFWSDLEERYRTHKHGDEHWQHEKPSLEALIPLIQESLSPRYAIRGALGVGGIGVVLRVEDLNLKTPCALKFPRPTTGRESLSGSCTAT